jgi:hypothetical protein
MIRAELKRRLKQVAVVVGIVAVFALVPALWWAERAIKSSGKHPTSAEQLNFWIQVVVGKWLPNSVPYGRTSFLYALSAGLALILNLVVIVALASLIISWVRKVRPLLLTLELENAMMTNEQVIHFLAARQIAEINKRIPDRETMATIRECFTVGEQNWLKELPGVVGERRAAKISAAMKQRSFDPEL